VGTPTSDGAWVQTTLPLSGEGGCGVASAVDVAPVARSAGVMQFLARAELMLGCDRQLVVPLANDAGLLDALNARLPSGSGIPGKLDSDRQGGTARRACQTPAVVVIPRDPGKSRGTPRGGHREGCPPAGRTAGG